MLRTVFALFGALLLVVLGAMLFAAHTSAAPTLGSPVVVPQFDDRAICGDPKRGLAPFATAVEELDWRELAAHQSARGRLSPHELTPMAALAAQVCCSAMLFYCYSDTIFMFCFLFFVFLFFYLKNLFH